MSNGIEDYEVEMFNGVDFEWIFAQSCKNRKKIEDVLPRMYNGTFKEMIEEEFGIHLDKKIRRQWFDENTIEFEFFSWIN